MTIVFDNSKAGDKITPEIQAIQEGTAMLADLATFDQFLKVYLEVGFTVISVDSGEIHLKRVFPTDGTLISVFNHPAGTVTETFFAT